MTRDHNKRTVEKDKSVKGGCEGDQLLEKKPFEWNS